jgi:hypothetical protein
MSLADSVGTAPQLLVYCCDAAFGKVEALEVRFRVCKFYSILFSFLLQRVLALISSGDQEQFQSALGGFHREYFLLLPSSSLQALTAAQP